MYDITNQIETLEEIKNKIDLYIDHLKRNSEICKENPALEIDCIMGLRFTHIPLCNELEKVGFIHINKNPEYFIEKQKNR